MPLVASAIILAALIAGCAAYPGASDEVTAPPADPATPASTTEPDSPVSSLLAGNITSHVMVGRIAMMATFSVDSAEACDVSFSYARGNMEEPGYDFAQISSGDDWVYVGGSGDLDRRVHAGGQDWVPREYPPSDVGWSRMTLHGIEGKEIELLLAVEHLGPLPPDLIEAEDEIGNASFVLENSCGAAFVWHEILGSDRPQFMGVMSESGGVSVNDPFVASVGALNNATFAVAGTLGIAFLYDCPNISGVLSMELEDSTGTATWRTTGSCGNAYRREMAGPDELRVRVSHAGVEWAHYGLAVLDLEPVASIAQLVPGLVAQ